MSLCAYLTGATSMCDCNKNQTSKKSIAALGKSGRAIDDELGSGVFLVPAPELGILEYKTVNVPRLTYRETVKRGEHCVAFKWISIGEASINAIDKSQQGCAGFCNFAGGQCPFGCMCGPGNFCSGSGPAPGPFPPGPNPPDPPPDPPDPPPDPPDPPVSGKRKARN